MKKVLIALLVLFSISSNANGQSCLTNSLIINTGYDPTTGNAITPGTNGGTPVPDPHWTITSISPDVAIAIAATPIPGLIEVAPANSADVVPVFGTTLWAFNPAGNPGGWISCLNSNQYYDDGTGMIFNMTLSRSFRMCSDDSIKLNFYIADDNYCSLLSIDGTILPFSQPPGTTDFFSTYANFTQTVFLTAGTHTINVVVNDFPVVVAQENPTGLDMYGTVSSATGTNSIVSESTTACNTYVCSPVCNTLSLPDTLHACTGVTDTLHGVVDGTDSILNIHWSPATGLSDTSVLNPALTVGTSSEWYYVTVESIAPNNLVANGDFSAGNSGFSSGYTLETTGVSSTPAHYVVDTNPFIYEAAWPAIGDHTTGTGNMLIVDGSYTVTDNFWCETLPVNPNTDYVFTLWGALLHTPQPLVQISINGIAVTTFTLSAVSAVWNKYQIIWNSGAATSAGICMNDLSAAGTGNDFAIDDISFQQLCVANDSIYVILCNPVCNTLSLPDTLHACTGAIDTLHGVVDGTDSILNIHWSPATGLSDTSVLNPALTTGITSGWYYLTVESLQPNNLVNNGNFTAGNTGFTSAYPYAVSGPGALTPAGYYTITTDPDLDNPFTDFPFGDHTTGTGNMMAMNGASTPIDVWCETISVTPNTNYAFSAWAANWSSDVTDNFPILQFEINGALIGPVFNFPHADGVWTQFYTTWNSGTNTSISICLYDEQTAASGNDFAIDDIAFQQLCTVTDSIYIAVTVPDTTFSVTDTAVCASVASVTLTSPAGYSSHLWNTTATTAAIVVNTTGTYWVSEYGNCHTLNDTFHVAFNPLPVVNIGNDTGFCQGDSVVLTSLQPAGNTYLWSNGSVNDSIYVFTTGTYWLTIGNGCSATDSIHIQVAPAPVVNLGADTTQCQANPVTLQSSVAYSSPVYIWSNGSTAANIVAATSGTYWLQVTNAGCPGSDTIHVAIVYDTLDFYNHDTAICKGANVQVVTNGNPAITYQWLPTAGIPNSTSPSPLISPDTTAMYVLHASFTGCPDIIDSFFLDVQPTPIVYIGGNRQVCQYDTLHINASVTPLWYSHYIYTWTPSGLLDNDTSQTVVFTAGDSSEIVLTVATPAGCTGIDSAQIIVHPDTFAVVSNDTNVCPHTSFQFIASGGSIYQWHPGIYLSDSNVAAPWVNAITSQSYSVSVTSVFGCVESFSVNVIVHPAAVISLGDSVTIYLGETYQLLPVTNCTSFAWFPPAGLSSAVISNPIASPTIDTKYIVYGTTEWGCTTEDSISVYVDPGTLLAVPNAFTPGAESNKIFYVLKKGIATLNYMRIFNRWGNKIFESNNIETGWDGTYNGVPQPFDVYVYEVQAVTNTGQIFTKHGNVTLLR